jgi:hypothetical protein
MAMPEPTPDLLAKALAVAERALDGDSTVTPRQHDMALAVLRGWTPKAPLPKGGPAAGSGALHITVGVLPDDDPELLAETERHRDTR